MSKKNNALNYRAIGMMSGTSLDGLDLACCKFTFKRRWEYTVESAETIPYNGHWRGKLSSAHLLSGEELIALDAEYGEFLAACCNRFIAKKKITDVDLVASHGHTVFHQPKRRFTFQLGDGHALHAITDLSVVYNFRRLDLALHGEGAPLVPIGDRHLFGSFDVCLNLGGIANLSAEKNKKRIAFDICFANMCLNYLAQKAGKVFDENGRIASRGKVNDRLFRKLSDVYQSHFLHRPSLGREGFELHIRSLLDDESVSLEDRMMTCCQSIAHEVKKALSKIKNKKTMMVTGGGAHHPVLIKLLKQESAGVIVPDKLIVDYKEALVFAFLGVLRLRGEENVLHSVTRADRNSSSGELING
jgi:anhydro-N-acetylmuramic acid kinase